MRLSAAARQGALALLKAGRDPKMWTESQIRDVTIAFNALQRLAGKKLRLSRGKLVGSA